MRSLVLWLLFCAVVAGGIVVVAELRTISAGIGRLTDEIEKTRRFVGLP